MTLVLNLIQMVQYAIISSKLDEASVNMREMILENYKFITSDEKFEGNSIHSYNNITLITTNQNLIEVEINKNLISEKSLIFISKHVSKKGIPAITSHFTGNVKEAELGGKRKEFGNTDPALMSEFMKQLKTSKNEINDYEITLEATHHGPTSYSVPILFVEIGSQIKNWQDKKTGKVVTKCLIDAICNMKNVKQDKGTGVGFGGLHYSRKFTELICQEGYSIAGYVSKHNLEFVDDEIILQMINKSIKKVDFIFLDWKGLGKNKNKILELTEKTGLEIIRV